MSRLALGILFVLFALPALADDTPQEKPTTPAQQYLEVIKEYQEALLAYQKARQSAGTYEEQLLLKYPRPDEFAPKFLALAEKHASDPAALDALLWVATHLGSQPPKGKNHLLARALEILLRDHIQSKELGRVCQSMSFRLDAPGETFLRQLLTKSPHKDVQAEACLALAQGLSNRATMVRHLTKNLEARKFYADALGKDYVEAMLRQDAAKVEVESEQFFRQFTDQHLGAMNPERLKSLCQALGANHTDQGSELVLRTLLDKHAARAVQGQACLNLATLLRRRADQLSDPSGKEASQARRQSEELFERAAEKYGDVIGDSARRQLYTLRFLSIGKVAPDIHGEDQDGKPLKLSDYRGKVVLLDFWSQG